MIWWILFAVTIVSFLAFAIISMKKDGCIPDVEDIFAVLGCGALLGGIFWILVCGLLINACIVPAMIKNPTYIEAEVYELHQLPDGEYYRQKPDTDCTDYRQILIYEDTKGLIYKDFHYHDDVYYIETNDNCRLVYYDYDWGSPVLNKLFFNPRSHYTFYIPEID